MVEPSLLEHLSSDARRTHDALVAGPTAPVAHCPGWSVTDLVRHHGDVHRWATAIVESGERQRTELTGPEPVEALAQWYVEGADRLVQVLAATDPDRECWTFGDPPHTVRFWFRRQALEAAIHRWDAQHAVGEPEGFAPTLAADGVAEVVEMFFPRQLRSGRTPPLSAPVALRATDVGAQWVLGASDDAAPVAEIAGPAGALFLLLWRRRTLGDPTLAYTGPAALRAELADGRFAP